MTTPDPRPRVTLALDCLRAPTDLPAPDSEMRSR